MECVIVRLSTRHHGIISSRDFKLEVHYRVDVLQCVASAVTILGNIFLECNYYYYYYYYYYYSYIYYCCCLFIM